MQDETRGSAGNEVLETNYRTKQGKYRKRGATNCRTKRGEVQETRCWKQITGRNEGNEVLETNYRTKRGKYRKRGAGNKLQDETREIQETRCNKLQDETREIQETRCNKLQDETWGSAGNEVLETNYRTKRGEVQETRCWKETNCRTKRGAGN